MSLRSPDVIEKRLLEEYKELGLCWRYDDEWLSKLTTVLLPLSIAALTLPYLKQGVPKLLAVSGGLALMTFWFLSSKIFMNRLGARFSRIHELEQILRFDSHLRYVTKRKKRILRSQNLRCWMFALYLLIAFFVTCDMKVEVISWPPNWQVLKSKVDPLSRPK